MLTEQILKSIDASVLCWLATVSKYGTPNVSPKEIFCALNHTHMLIANIASPGSVRNIKANPKVCVSFVDVFEQRGFKLIGTAEIIRKNHDVYSEVYAPLYVLAGDAYPIASIILITVSDVEQINAPSYHLFPDTPFDERKSAAMQNYGVKPI